MATIEQLEQRIAALERKCQKLEDIESIKRVRYAYWRCMREAQFDELVDLFSENAIVNLGPFGAPAEGKQAITHLYQSIVAPITPARMSFPRGFIPEIEFTGEDSARAIWLGEGPRIDSTTQMVSNVGFIYHEEYLREKGVWKISSLKVSSSFTTQIKLVPPPEPPKD